MVLTVVSLDELRGKLKGLWFPRACHTDNIPNFNLILRDFISRVKHGGLCGTCFLNVMQFI